ncbi:unnamed protein product [Strongylus vulgaris]|uniref:Uncharacterized protein n=1 Tax=Strongylus vulgaris TaxID=40348 RepID=A0A3P7J858_STRVU|nr:unnamed protein product [Strongylus vulgaris]
MLILVVVVFALLAEVNSQARDGAATGGRARQLSQARIFDLPKFAPTARIIKLSTLLRKGKQKEDDDLLRDAVSASDSNMLCTLLVQSTRLKQAGIL